MTCTFVGRSPSDTDMSHAILIGSSPTPGGLRAGWLLTAVAAIVLAPATSCPLWSAPRQVTVRFVDPKSGKPLRNLWVLVDQWKGKPAKGPMTDKYFVSDTRARTDRNGEVVVDLREPLPAFISVLVPDLWNSGDLLPVNEVLKSGVVLDYSGKGMPAGYWVDSKGRPIMKSGTSPKHGGKKKASPRFVPAAKPGVIVYVEKKITAWERMRMELPW